EDGIRDFHVTGVQTCALPIYTLLVNRRTYLTEHWDGWVWPEPGAGTPQIAPRVATPDQPAEITATRLVGDTLWLHVAVLDHSPRSEERRVGKAWRARGRRQHQ